MTFDPDAYWIASGPHLARESVSLEHQLQESVLSYLLPSLGKVGSVLDVGCGQGRLARFLLTALPDAEYSGMDLGQAQLDGTKEARPDGTFYLSRLQDFQTDRQWELVICSEVLLHIPPADIVLAVKRLRALTSRWLITIDWTQPLNREVAAWNWLHDYMSLFGGAPLAATRVGDQTVYLWQA